MIQQLCLLLFLSSCALNNTHKHSNKALSGLAQYWLTTSMYAGACAQDNGLTLLDAAFIKATHIVPVGTLVQITEVKQNNLGPEKKQFWVHLKVAKERGQVSIFEHKPHVLIIPEQVKTKDQLKKYLTNFMSKQDPHPWILKTRAYIQEGIWNKQPVIGMGKRELLAAMGPARKKTTQKNPDTNQNQEIWHYANYFVLIDNEEVTKVKKLSAQTNLAKK